MVLVTIGGCLYSGGFVFANEHGFHPTLTGLSRGLTLIVVVYFLLRYFKKDITFKSVVDFKRINLRSSIMVLQHLSYSAVQYYLPLPIAITLSTTTPIFVCIYDYLLYGIAINHLQIFFLVLSVIGVLITANGAYLITLVDSSYSN